MERGADVGRVTLEVNGKSYVFGCEDGGEDHLRTLAARVDARIRQIAPEAGALGEARLMLMAALTIGDDLHVAEHRLAEAKAEAEARQKAMADLEARTVGALEAAADRLDLMAPDLTAGQPLLL